MIRSAYALLFAFAALSVSAADAQTSAPAMAANPKLLAFVTNNSSDYWTICRKGTEAEARKLGVSVQFVEPADGSAAMQQKNVDSLLTRGVSGIAISPVDPAGETAYLNTVAARVPLITADSDAPASRRLCYIGADNHAAGRQAGRLLRQALPHGGQVMLFVGSRTAQNARDRKQGIRDALRGSRIQIVGVREDQTNHARAVQNAVSALAEYPHLAAIVGLWSYNGPAAFVAARAAGKIGQVKIVCFDQEAGTMAGIQSGAIYATVVQQPYLFGVQSVALLARLVKGNKKVSFATRRIIVPTLAVTHGTIRAYLRHQALLLQGK